GARDARSAGRVFALEHRYRERGRPHRGYRAGAQMSVVEVPGESSPNDRRRDERRLNSRLADLPTPEVRRAVLTWLLTATAVLLFLWMVRRVLIAGILGVVIAAYLRLLYLGIHRKTGRPILSAVLTLLVVIIPVLGAIPKAVREAVVELTAATT